MDAWKAYTYKNMKTIKKEKAYFIKVIASVVVRVFLFVYKAPAQTQQAFTKIDKSKDLSSGSITSITQDKDGFIWIGTKSGLSRYDGTSFKVYHQQAGGLSADDISVVFVDSKDRMWVGTLDGLNLFNNNTEQFVSFKYEPRQKTSLSSNEVNIIFEDADGNIWIGTEKGLNRFVQNESSFIRFAGTNHTSYSLNNIKSISEDATKNLWIGTFGNGLTKFDRDKGKIAHP